MSDPIFQAPADILSDMLADHKAITGVALAPTDIKREEVIKYMTVSGAISGMLSQGQRVFDDFFPGSSSEDGLVKGLAWRGLPARAIAQPSTGTIRNTAGADGAFIDVGTQLSRDSDGAVFVAITSGTITGGHVDITYQSLEDGADKNLDQIGQSFTMITSISGLDSSVLNTTEFLNGRDLETPAEMLTRIEAHDQDANSGGNLAAYEAWAKAASPSVVTATAIKDPRGAGTVNTVITSGTTDIEGAVRAGTPVTRLPGTDLINTVQAYILTQNPVTDDHLTVAPTEETFNSTIAFDLYDESKRTLVGDEITILWKIFVYSAAANSLMYPTDLERNIDASVGHLIKARRVLDFSGGDGSYAVPASKLEAPGALTLQSMAGV